MDAKLLAAILVPLLCPLMQAARAETAPEISSRPANGESDQTPNAFDGDSSRVPSPVPGGVVRLYQVRRETQVTDVKVTRSDSPAFIVRLSVEGDSVVLHHDEGLVRYRIIGHRLVYQAADEDGNMQSSAPALVASRCEHGRVEVLTVTPKQLTILRSLEAMEGYVLTTARFIGERPLAALSPHAQAQASLSLNGIKFFPDTP
ncbi:MAG: hypothetical protein JO015_06115 [Verrucomicrobia bacterium]|nr:hypothetical protein [Verrucomicrobiota bacterium]